MKKFSTLTRLNSEKINYLTHFIAFILWIPLSAWLIVLSWGQWELTAATLAYGLGVIFLFFNSSQYHKYKSKENEKSLRRTLDHLSIYIMIAGSYTLVIHVWFEPQIRVLNLVLIWTVAIAGTLLKLFYPKAPRWLSPILYLGMGWVAGWSLVFLFNQMSWDVFLALAGGGILYSIGAIIYALKKPNPVPGHLGFHEIFHLFIIAAALWHFYLMYQTVLKATL